jgi:hypothetical protein
MFVTHPPELVNHALRMRARTARDADRPGPWRAAGNGPRLARGADTSQRPGGTELSDLRRGRTASRVWPIPTSTFSASTLATAASRHIRGVFRLRVVLDAAYPSIVDQAAQAIQQVRPRNTLGRRRREYNDIEIPSYSKAWPCLLPQHGPGRSANDASSSSRGSWISPALCRACSFVGSSTPTGADSSTPGATDGARRGMHSAVSRPTSERSSPTPASSSACARPPLARRSTSRAGTTWRCSMRTAAPRRE